MGWPFVRRRMQGELGPDWQSRFTRFDQAATAAASLGQVHRATLPDGTEVACKLQIPDMTSTVEADLRQLKLAMAVYHRMDGAIQHDEIYAELSDRLREELDYTREAAQQRLYRLMLADVPEVHLRPRRGFLHQTPADHDLARRPPTSCAASRKTPPLRSATPSPKPSSRPGALLPLRRHPR
jgi:hypothetical protein